VYRQIPEPTVLTFLGLLILSKKQAVAN